MWTMCSVAKVVKAVSRSGVKMKMGGGTLKMSLKYFMVKLNVVGMPAAGKIPIGRISSERYHVSLHGSYR